MNDGGASRSGRNGRVAVAALLLTASLVAAEPAQAGSFLVDSAADSGPGSLRHAIRQANSAPGSTITVELGEREQIVVESALPAIVADGIRLDGRGVTLREAVGCRRAGGKAGCDGLVVSASGVIIRNLRVAGFTFDGVAVRGSAAREVRLERIDAVDNLDDGVGVSNGAGPVLVEHSLLMGNGYRTKGKGLLVFDAADATLRDSLVLANRDGVTVSKDAKATLERVVIAGNWDKGLGIAGASAGGNQVDILANGRDEGPAAPNRDGLRVGLGGVVSLGDCRIAGNGDGGVVVLDDSNVTLERCIVEANRGRPVSVAPAARLERAPTKKAGSGR